MAVQGADSAIEVGHPRHTSEGIKDKITLGAESLQPIVDLTKINLTLTARRKTRVGERDQLIFIGCHTYGGAFETLAFGDESVQCLERFALNLGLERTEPKEPNGDLEELESRIAVLEKASLAGERRLRSFISFKFDDAATTAQVERLKRFLSALGIEWVTGEQFEPRRIEDKVKAKLRADVHFIIAVVSKAGESQWIRDEISDANARELWVILLLQDGVTFDKGIFGTLEYIPYDRVIDETFLRLLEGINFIKAELSSSGVTA